MRHDVTNDWIAVMSSNGTIKTFFEPDEGVFYYQDEIERYGPHFMAPGMLPPEEKP